MTEALSDDKLESNPHPRSLVTDFHVNSAALEVIVNSATYGGHQILMMEGFDAAIIGVTVTASAGSPEICYDREFCLQIIQKRNGIDRDAAMMVLRDLANALRARHGIQPSFLIRPFEVEM